MARVLTVDRVAMLRHVGIFAATPGRVLAGLAGASSRRTLLPVR